MAWLSIYGTFWRWNPLIKKTFILHWLKALPYKRFIKRIIRGLEVSPSRSVRLWTELLRWIQKVPHRWDFFFCMCLLHTLCESEIVIYRRHCKLHSELIFLSRRGSAFLYQLFWNDKLQRQLRTWYDTNAEEFRIRLIRIFIYFEFLLSPKLRVQLKRVRAWCLNSPNTDARARGLT